MERKWIERKYHVQDNASVELKDVKMYCNTNKFPALPFCSPHSKHHGARGLGKHYHLSFYPKLGMGEYSIHCIPCVCVLLVHQCWKNRGYLVYHQINKIDINLSPSALIGQYQDTSTIGTLSNFHQSQHLPTHLMKFTRFFLME